MLTFDDKAHRYFWNGIPVPGVTTLLRPIHNFDGVPASVLEEARRRGTYVHRMTELHDAGDLDEEALRRGPGARYLGYLRAWKDFIEQHEVEIIESEERGYCSLGFAGTWDRWARLTYRRSRSVAMVDIKTAHEASRAWGVQTAAYRRIKAGSDPAAALAPRFSVQLLPEGEFQLIAWNDPNDWPTFEALLRRHQAEQVIQRWKEAA